MYRDVTRRLAAAPAKNAFGGLATSHITVWCLSWPGVKISPWRLKFRTLSTAPANSGRSTQAVTLGLDSDGFNYGIGRYAFSPLGDEDVLPPGDEAWGDVRIIGCAHGGEAVAVSVLTLSRHETAKLTVGDMAVTVA